MASKIKCLREPGRYFESEFRHNPDGTIKTPYIHERGNPHYINGMLVNPGKDPLTVWRVQNLELEMDSLLLEIDPESFSYENSETGNGIEEPCYGIVRRRSPKFDKPGKGNVQQIWRFY